MLKFGLAKGCTGFVSAVVIDSRCLLVVIHGVCLLYSSWSPFSNDPRALGREVQYVCLLIEFLDIL